MDVSFAIVQRSGGPLASLPTSTYHVQPAVKGNNRSHFSNSPMAAATRSLDLPSYGAFAPTSASPFEPGQMRKVLVRNLSAGIVDDDDLTTLFSPYGAIVEARLHTHPNTGLPTGAGYVVFSSPDEAALAQHDMNKKPAPGGNEGLVSQITTVTDSGQPDSGPDSPANTRPSPAMTREDIPKSSASVHQRRVY
jgi:RNA recognition motif-containing protein